jgi:hypothetical protein
MPSCILGRKCTGVQQKGPDRYIRKDAMKCRYLPGGLCPATRIKDANHCIWHALYTGMTGIQSQLSNCFFFFFLWNNYLFIIIMINFGLNLLSEIYFVLHNLRIFNENDEIKQRGKKEYIRNARKMKANHGNQRKALLNSSTQLLLHCTWFRYTETIRQVIAICNA